MGELINEDDPLGEVDPLVYGGQLTELRGGPADGGNFLIAPDPLLVAGYDMVYGREPTMQSGAHLIATFKGRVNNTDNLAAYTLIIPYGTSRRILRHLQKLTSEVPIHLRITD